MEEKLKKIFGKYYELIRQMFLYGLIGGLAAAIDFVLFFLLNDVLHLYWLVANFISVYTGVTVSFLLNTYFNFKKTDKLLKRGISFYAIGTVGMGLSELIMWLGVDVLNQKEIIVKLVSVFLVAAFQFVLNKLITYRSEK